MSSVNYHQGRRDAYENVLAYIRGVRAGGAKSAPLEGLKTFVEEQRRKAEQAADKKVTR